MESLATNNKKTDKTAYKFAMSSAMSTVIANWRAVDDKYMMAICQNQSEYHTIGV